MLGPHVPAFSRPAILEPRNSLTLKLISKVQTTENPLFQKRKWVIVLTWVLLQFFDIKILWNFSKELSELESFTLEKNFSKCYLKK
jgi:hypothetical protein